MTTAPISPLASGISTLSTAEIITQVTCATTWQSTFDSIVLFGKCNQTNA